ncbi:MAG: glycosyltransferase [Mogibacterium sp.]|nr:glycosyltransferase [Mogibacterium sp.]
MIYPLISVIIPAYNAEKYLGKCLDSVLAQTYPRLEVIIVDDGSSDRTNQIAESYAAENPEIFRVIHTENQGVTAARLRGIEAAGGEWIGFADADDIVMPDMYERLYQNALQYQADISHCGHKTIVNDGERVHDFCNQGLFLCQDRNGALKYLLEGRFEPSLCTKLFRRELVTWALRKNEVDKEIIFNEDLLLNYYFFSESEKSVFEDFCGYHYISHSGSATRGEFNIKRLRDPMRVRHIIMESAEGELKIIAKEKYLTACAHAYMTLNGNDMHSFAEDMHRLREEIIRYHGDWGLLRRNDYIKLRLLMISPTLFKRIYGFYEKYLQKKIYE